MTHFELTYYRIYPSALRITANYNFNHLKDNDLTELNYVYLVKDENDAETLMVALMNEGYKVEAERLYKEIE